MNPVLSSEIVFCIDICLASRVPFALIQKTQDQNKNGNPQPQNLFH